MSVADMNIMEQAFKVQEIEGSIILINYEKAIQNMVPLIKKSQVVRIGGNCFEVGWTMSKSAKLIANSNSRNVRIKSSTVRVNSQ